MSTSSSERENWDIEFLKAAFSFGCWVAKDTTFPDAPWMSGI